MEMMDASPNIDKVGRLNKTYIKRAEIVKGQISTVLASQAVNGLVSRDIFYQTLNKFGIKLFESTKKAIELKRIPRFVDVLPYKEVMNSLMCDLRATNPFERPWIVYGLDDSRKSPIVEDK